jgi:predicted esterase
MNQLDFTHRYIPPSAGSTRVLLLLHGSGGNEEDLLALGRQLDENAALLSPRGKVIENGMPRFFRRFAEGVFDEEDVVRRANELAEFIRAATDTYKFKIEDMIAVGYSNGANIAAAILFLRPEVLTRAILFRAMVPLSNPPTPDLSAHSILISAGHDDPIIPLGNVRGLTSLLDERGAEVQLEIQQASHGLVPEDLLVAEKWLAPT